MRISEGSIEKRLVKMVSQLGGKAYKWVSPGNTGVPDRIVILPGGRIILIEMKAADGRLSPQQRVQKMKLEKLGADVRVLDSMGDVDDFIAEVTEDAVQAT